MKRILVVGGAGYIGSHTVKALKKASYCPIVYDNLSSGKKEAILNNKLVVGELSDKVLLSQVIKEEGIEAVMHFAGKIEVGESVANPIKYLKNNCLDGVNLILAMIENGVKNLIFSSTAAVYGEPENLPITEEASAKPVNPYGLSKLLFEKILEFYRRSGQINYVSLRYFNAAGADIDGLLGDDHKNKTHLITSAILTALGQRKKLKLFGIDYPTFDGTCIRDYIHVDDLATAHVLALEFLVKTNKSAIFNLGNGKGLSNKQVIEAVKKITKVDFKVEEVGRREGDSPVLVASAVKAKHTLGFEPKHSDLQTIIKTAFKWHKTYPSGYQIPE